MTFIKEAEDDKDSYSQTAASEVPRSEERCLSKWQEGGGESWHANFWCYRVTQVSQILARIIEYIHEIEFAGYFPPEAVFCTSKSPHTVGLTQSLLRIPLSWLISGTFLAYFCLFLHFLSPTF